MSSFEYEMETPVTKFWTSDGILFLSDNDQNKSVKEIDNYFESKQPELSTIIAKDKTISSHAYKSIKQNIEKNNSKLSNTTKNIENKKPYENAHEENQFNNNTQVITQSNVSATYSPDNNNVVWYSRQKESNLKTEQQINDKNKECTSEMYDLESMNYGKNAQINKFSLKNEELESLSFVPKKAGNANVDAARMQNIMLTNSNGRRGQLAEAESSADNIFNLFKAIVGNGQPGVDYPILSSIPQTEFKCNASGYFVDTSEKAQCQV